MKTNPSSRDQAILWIGETTHIEAAPLWQWCQKNSDTIAVRSSLRDATSSPPRGTVQWVLVMQANRQDADTNTTRSSTNVRELGLLRSQHPNARLLLVRGALVAPSVILPPTDPATTSGWIESISCHEAANYLSASFGQPDLAITHQAEQSQRPIVVIASQYWIAEGYIDAIEMLPSSNEHTRPWITWQRELNARQSRGNATILWDDSVAHAETHDGWQRRFSAAPDAKHLWATGMATRGERSVAEQAGVAAIVEKPGRLECLARAIHAA